MHLGAALRVLAGGRATGWSMALIPGTEISQTPNAGEVERGSETAGDKLRSREGNSPEHRLRPPSVC